MEHAFNTSTLVAEIGRSLRVLGHPWLHSETLSPLTPNNNNKMKSIIFITKHNKKSISSLKQKWPHQQFMSRLTNTQRHRDTHIGFLPYSHLFLSAKIVCFYDLSFGVCFSSIIKIPHCKMLMKQLLIIWKAKYTKNYLKCEK